MIYPGKDSNADQSSGQGGTILHGDCGGRLPRLARSEAKQVVGVGASMVVVRGLGTGLLDFAHCGSEELEKYVDATVRGGK